MTEPLRVLSLGAGVQSTVVLLMSLAGELPDLDAAIFADTGWEPPEVYGHLWKLAAECDRADLPLYVVSKGNIRDDHLAQKRTTIPFFMDSGRGVEGKLRRSCTADYKVVPIERQIRILRDGRDVEQWFGISLDEVQRMRDSDKAWKRNVYPLVDLRMSRWDCHRWLDAHGWTAPRSACVGCPFHSNDEWRRLRDNDPESWDDAVRFDASMRVYAGAGGNTMRGVPFLHRSMVPLDEVDLSTPAEHGQGSMFDNECAGVCGV